jgi:hypothetical protein
MNIEKALKRERQQEKRKNGMRVHNKSIFTIQEVQKKKSDLIKERRKQKELEREIIDE